MSQIITILSPQSAYEIQVLDGESWRPVAGEKVPDQQPRHHAHASAATTARFPPVLTDRFRIVFTAERKPDAPDDVIFELRAR